MVNSSPYQLGFKYSLESCKSKYFRMNNCSNLGLMSYFDFSFVQNPLDRAIVSYEKSVLNMNVVQFYKHDERGEQQVVKNIMTKFCTFEKFLKLNRACKIRSMPTKQWPNIFSSSSANQISRLDKVGRIEHFDVDMAYVLKRIFGKTVLRTMKMQNVTLEILPTKNNSIISNDNLQSVHNANAINFVREYYKRDWQLLNYN